MLQLPFVAEDVECVSIGWVRSEIRKVFGGVRSMSRARPHQVTVLHYFISRYLMRPEDINDLILDWLSVCFPLRRDLECIHHSDGV